MRRMVRNRGRCVNLELGWSWTDLGRRLTRDLGVSLATGFVFAAGGWAIGFVREDIVVACGADYAVNGFAELIVSCAGGVFVAGLFAADGHGFCSGTLKKTF